MRIKNLLLRITLLVSLVAHLTIQSTRLQADTGTCSGVTITLPFTDVMGSPFFCQIASAFYSGLTNGTTATTYNPGLNVSRDQMAAFISRTLDQSLERRSRVFVLGRNGNVYQINPASPGAASTVTNLPATFCFGMAYDGTRLFNRHSERSARFRAPILITPPEHTSRASHIDNDPGSKHYRSCGAVKP